MVRRKQHNLPDVREISMLTKLVDATPHPGDAGLITEGVPTLSPENPSQQADAPSSQSAHDAAVAIAATFTAEPLLPGLRLVLDAAALPLDVSFCPYHQVFQELLSSTSTLATNAGGVNVVLVRFEDFVRDVQNIEAARVLVERTMRELSEALNHYVQHVKIPTVVAALPSSHDVPEALEPDLEAARASFIVHARSLPGIACLSNEEIDSVSTGERYDSLSDEVGHVPFTDEHYGAIALALVRKVHALRVPAHKVLVLDCDNTLWRGVVGEDGVGGIEITPAFACVQQYAADVQAQGALICLLSKNAERDVLEVFEKRTDMILKLEQIVAHRINWEPKPKNISSLARMLNLGLDSFVFLDDNPVECALMRAELPEVVTLQLPPDDEIKSFLHHLWTFDKIGITKEDARRTSMYRENAARQEHEETTTDIAEFIESLQVVTDIAAPQDNEWTRVAQLTQRTNQFNFTTKRRTEAEMRAAPNHGAIVLRINVRDRFGDYGLVGVVIAHASADVLLVDTFLLSCRVLGRGVEHAILRHLGELAAGRTLSHVHLPYVPSPKNEPARAFAESVAEKYRSQERESVLYRIPVEEARSIAHRPGHDPAAVIEARKSEESKVSASDSAGISVPAADRSERYANLARVLVSGREVGLALKAGAAKSRTLSGEAAAPATETERKLLLLWQDLLGIDGLGVEDDYFRLGGTSLLATRLIAEIARKFGVKLKLTAILELSTVRALSRHLDPNGAQASGPLVELRRGGSRKFFLVHDGDGETLLYLNLARRMPQEFSVYGIEPICLPRVPLAHTRIEDMAACYVKSILQIQPRGPYFLGGMCAGGVIAYEMASQLLRAGESVDLVALLDAATPQASRQPGLITRQRFERLTHALADGRGRGHASLAWSAVRTISQKAANALAWEIRQRVQQTSARARFRLLHELLARQIPWPAYLPELSLRQIYDSAEARYLPHPLLGTQVVLVRARTGQAGDTPYREIYADEAFGWGALAQMLTIVDVEGGHSSMLQEPFVDSLATELMPFLNRGSRLAHVELAS